MVVGIGCLVGRNQSRSLYTVITFPNPHAKFPFASSFSTFPLPCSLSPPPLPLLCFHFPLLSLISDPAETLRLQFLQRCIHSFLRCSLPHSPASRIPSMPTPPSAWLLAGAYFTVAHIKQPDEGNTVRLFGLSEEYDPSQGHIVRLCPCVFFPTTLVWNIEDEENKLGLFALNTWNRRIWEFSTENPLVKLYWIYCSGEPIIMHPWHSVN